MAPDLGLLQDLLEIAEDPHASVDDFFARLERCPGLREAIVRVGNSSLYGMEGRIGTLERAVLVLGLQATTAIVATLLAGRDPLGLRRLECALAARLLSRELGLSDPHQAFLGTLAQQLELPRAADPARERLAEAAAALLAPGQRGPSRRLEELGLDEADQDALRASLELELKEAVRVLGVHG